jgi:uncharacterized membrane protein YhhN
VITAIGVVMALAVGGTLWAEAERREWRRPFKMIAASGFLAVAVVGGALDATFGRIMLVGLVLAWIGDLALTYSGRRAFVAGLVAFLLAHVAYIVAFVVPNATERHERGVDWALVGNVAAVLAVLALVIGWRLLPRVPKELRIPVVAYIFVISTMVALAGGHTISVVGPLTVLVVEHDWRIVTGAILFYVSDLAVARDRFVSPGIVNRMWGLPAYFAGQFLLAWAAGGPLP